MNENENEAAASLDGAATAPDSLDETPHVDRHAAMLVQLRAAAGMAAAAKKRLMLDELADAVIAAIDALITASTPPAQG